MLLALFRWAAASPKERDPLIADLVVHCARSEQMDLKQLEALDQHPCVMQSAEATMVVAGLYLSKLMGFGMLGSSSRRGRASAISKPRTFSKQQGSGLVKMPSGLEPASPLLAALASF